jgi:hypothetical protein
MAIGFPPRYARSRAFPLGEAELIARAKAALEDLGWPYKVEWGEELVAVPDLMWNYARREELRLRFRPGGVIRAESRCVGYPQIFDFGKNRRNVELFFARFEQLMGA